MPIYEYECQKCHYQFDELILSETQAHPSRCPACGAKRLKRRISSFARSCRNCSGCSICSGRLK